jgi:hypothetical protein
MHKKVTIYTCFVCGLEAVGVCREAGELVCKTHACDCIEDGHGIAPIPAEPAEEVSK